MIALGFYMDCATCMDVVRCFTFTDLLIGFSMHPVVQSSSPVHSKVMANLIFMSPLNFMVALNIMGFNTVLCMNYINFSMPIMYNACLLHCIISAHVSREIIKVH